MAQAARKVQDLSASANHRAYERTQAKRKLEIFDEIEDPIREIAGLSAICLAGAKGILDEGYTIAPHLTFELTGADAENIVQGFEALHNCLQALRNKANDY